MGNRNYTVSIDLGSSKVVAALGTLSAKGEVIVKELVCKPMEGFIRGEISNIESVTAALNETVEELEQKSGIKVDEAVVSVSGRQIVYATNSGFIYVGSDGEIHDEDVKKLCDNMNNVQAPEGRTILSRIPQFYKIDSKEINCSPVGSFGRHLEATFGFVMASKSTLERISKAFDRIGIKERTFVPAATASALVTTFEDEREAGVAVVDIGAGTTDVCVYFDNKVRYVASIPLGAETINNDIRATAIPKRSVEKLKTKHGYATTSAIPFDMLNNVIRIPGRTSHEKNKDISYRDLTKIIECRLLDIITFVIDELKESGFHSKIGSIVLTGGCAQLKGIDTLFAERTGFEVRIGVPECNISAESTMGINFAPYATAVGLLALDIAQRPIEHVENTTPKDPTQDEEEEDNNSNKKRRRQEKKSKEDKEEEKTSQGSGWFRRLITGFDTLIFGQDVVDDEDM